MQKNKLNIKQDNLDIINTLQDAYNSLFNNILTSINMLAQEEDEENVFSLLLSFARLIIYYESAVIYAFDENNYTPACTMNLTDELNEYFNIESNREYYEWAKLQLRVIVIPENEQLCHIIAPIVSNQNYMGVLHLCVKEDSTKIIKHNLDMLWLMVNSVAAKISQIRLGKHSKLIESILTNLKKINTSKSLKELTHNTLKGIKNLINVDSIIIIQNNNKLIIETSDNKLLKFCFIKEIQNNSSCNLLCSIDYQTQPVYISLLDKDNFCKQSCPFFEDFLKTNQLLFTPLKKEEDLWGLFVLSEPHYNNKLKDHETKNIIALFAEQVTITIRQLKLMEDINTEKEKALTYSKAKSDFFATISHEIRTPLSLVIGNAEIMQMGLLGNLEEKQKNSVDQIKLNAEHLLNIINDILDISKIEMGEIKIFPEPSNHKKIINEIVLLLKPLSEKKNITIEVTLKDKLEQIIVDPVRFKQILFNLISNSIKYTLDNGNVTIRSDYNKKEKVFKLSIVDTGVGISQKDYDKVFVPFQQIRNFRIKNQQGTGLGLAITRKLVELHQGSIYFESQIGKGTTFVVELPVK